MIRVLAVDPGQRVGWATATISGGFQAPPDPKPELHVHDHGIAFLKDMALAVHRAVVVEDRYDVVIYETFLLNKKRLKQGDDLQSSQFIGAVRLACWVNGRVQLVPQGPKAMSDADKSLRNDHPSAPDIRERLAKLPKTHDDAHDGSALRHLWTYFFERYV